MTLYRIDYTADKSQGAWVRSHTESLVRLGVLVPVEPAATWFTIEDAYDELFCELWALGKVKPVPLDDDDE